MSRQIAPRHVPRDGGYKSALHTPALRIEIRRDEFASKMPSAAAENKPHNSHRRHFGISACSQLQHLCTATRAPTSGSPPPLRYPNLGGIPESTTPQPQQPPSTRDLLFLLLPTTTTTTKSSPPLLLLTTTLPARESSSPSSSQLFSSEPARPTIYSTSTTAAAAPAVAALLLMLLPLLESSHKNPKKKSTKQLSVCVVPQS